MERGADSFRRKPAHAAGRGHGDGGPPPSWSADRTNFSRSAANVSEEQVSLNKQICKAAEQGTSEILSLCALHHTSMSLVNISTALHKLARNAKNGYAVERTDPRFLLLRMQMRIHLEKQRERASILPRCLSTIAWAHAILNVSDDEAVSCLHTISAYAVSHLNAFKNLELTNLVWALAKLKVHHDELFANASDLILRRVSEFSQANLSTIVWAFVTVRHFPCKILLCRVSEAFVIGIATSAQVNSAEITNFVWALATAQHKLSPELLGVVADDAARNLSSFKLYELSITAWAFSRLGFVHDVFFHTCANLLRSSAQLRAQIHPQGIANLLWAFAKQVELGSSVADRMQVALPMLIPSCARLLNKLKMLELSCVLWSLTKLGVRIGQDPSTDELFYAAAMHINPLQQISLHSCINLLGAYARFTMGCEAPIDFTIFQRKLARVTSHHAGDFQPVSETSILDAVSVITDDSLEIQTLTSCAVAAITRDIKRFNKPGLVRLAAVVPALDESFQRLLVPVITNRLLELGHAEIPETELGSQAGVNVDGEFDEDEDAAFQVDVDIDPYGQDDFGGDTTSAFKNLNLQLFATGGTPYKTGRVECNVFRGDEASKRVPGHVVQQDWPLATQAGAGKAVSGRAVQMPSMQQRSRQQQHEMESKAHQAVHEFNDVAHESQISSRKGRRRQQQPKRQPDQRDSQWEQQSQRKQFQMHSRQQVNPEMRAQCQRKPWKSQQQQEQPQRGQVGQGCMSSQPWPDHSHIQEARRVAEAFNNYMPERTSDKSESGGTANQGYVVKNTFIVSEDAIESEEKNRIAAARFSSMPLQTAKQTCSSTAGSRARLVNTLPMQPFETKTFQSIDLIEPSFDIESDIPLISCYGDSDINAKSIAVADNAKCLSTSSFPSPQGTQDRVDESHVERVNNVNNFAEISEVMCDDLRDDTIDRPIALGKISDRSGCNGIDAIEELRTLGQRLSSNKFLSVPPSRTFDVDEENGPTYVSPTQYVTQGGALGAFWEDFYGNQKDENLYGNQEKDVQTSMKQATSLDLNAKSRKFGASLEDCSEEATDPHPCTTSYVVRNTFVESNDGENGEFRAARLKAQQFFSVQPQRTCDNGYGGHRSAATIEDISEKDESDDDDKQLLQASL